MRRILGIWSVAILLICTNTISIMGGQVGEVDLGLSQNQIYDTEDVLEESANSADSSNINTKEINTEIESKQVDDISENTEIESEQADDISDNIDETESTGEETIEKDYEDSEEIENSEIIEDEQSTEEIETEEIETEAVQRLMDNEIQNGEYVQILNSAGEKIKEIEVKRGAARLGIQKALDYVRDNAGKNNILTVRLPEGEYTIDRTLNLYGNMIFDLSAGVTLKRASNVKAMIRFGRSTDDEGRGYDTYQNISIIGSKEQYAVLDGNEGTSSIMRFAHAMNVYVQYIRFTNVKYAHHMEFAASKNVTIENCRFDGYINAAEVSDKNFEAIQMDILDEKHFPSYGIYDGTISKDVWIVNNSFENVSRGVGCHSGKAGHYFKNIHITDNTFDQVTGYAVIAVNFKKSEISRNVIKNSGAGILFRYMTYHGWNYYPGDMSSISTNASSQIKENQIQLVNTGYYNRFGIWLYGQKTETDIEWSDATGNYTIPKGDYRIKGMTVVNNTISTDGQMQGICAEGVYNSDISGNTIFERTFANTTGQSQGIHLTGCTNITLMKNNISGMNRDTGTMSRGIFLENGSRKCKISDNRIGNINGKGILVKASAPCTIEKNTVSNTHGDAVYIEGEEKYYDICVKNNKIDHSVETGLYVNGHITADISKNAVTDTGSCGLIFSSESRVKVDKNEINKSGFYGIAVNRGSSGNLTKNTVKNTASNGIDYSSKSMGNVKENKIIKCRGNGIEFSSGSIGNIAKNTVDDSKLNGMIVGEGYSGSVKSNKVINSKENGIVCVADSNAILKENKIGKCKKYGIVLGDGSEAGITSNKIDSCKMGMLCMFGSRGTVSDNSIKKCKKNVIYVQKGKKYYNINLGTSKIGSVKSDGKKVKLTWKKTKTANRYVVYRSDKKGGKYKQVAVVSKAMYTDKKVKKGKSYYYKILPEFKSGQLIIKGKTSSIQKVKVKK